MDVKEAEQYFNITTTDAKEYAAAVGDYLNKTKTPKAYKDMAQKPAEKKAGEAAKVKDTNKRNNIKRLCIKGMTKGV